MWQRLRHAQLLWPSVFAAAGLCLLIGLGVWQLERLNWKEGLIARLTARVAAEPLSLAAVEQRWQQDQDVDYLHALAKGLFHHDQERFVYAPQPGSLGWYVYAPLEVAPGRMLWVNRGWVDDPHKPPQARSRGQVEGETKVSGLIRRTPAPGPFTPSNDVGGNLWYWPDLVAMTRSAFGPGIEVLPFRLEADREPLPPGGLPRGGVTRLDLPNHHLQYAVTWFALGLTLIAVYFAFVRHRLALAAPGTAGKTPDGS